MEKTGLFLARLWIVVAMVLVTRRSSAESVGDVWDEIKSLQFLGGEEFKRMVNPLVEMAANAYRYPGVITIPGWTLLNAVAPAHGGMHALVYQDDFNSARMVLAFRGTDITGSESSRADICADEILWDEVAIPSGDCSEFSSDTLDYYKQAVDYTRQMLEAHPQASFLLTGHSLGAGLAILVTATFRSTPLLPVIAFSSAGTKTVLERMSLKLTSDHDKNLYIVADKWDEVMRMSWENQIGTLCLYETTITEDCVACFEDGKTIPSTGSSNDSSTSIDFQSHTPGKTQNSVLQVEEVTEKTEMDVTPMGQALIGSSVDCVNCFFETHYLRHVIDLVDLGNKPVCEFRGVPNFQAAPSVGGTRLSSVVTLIADRIQQ